MKEIGRPKRPDHPQRTTLYLSRKTKAKLFRLSTEWDCSMGKVVETLIMAVAEAPDSEECIDAEGTEV